MTNAPYDRRQTYRAPIELTVEYKNLNSFFADYTRNISHGGTFIHTVTPLSVGTEFSFQLFVPQLNEPIILKGKVQRVINRQDASDTNPEGMGVIFIYANEEEKNRISQLVENLMTQSLGPEIYQKLLKKAPLKTPSPELKY